MDTTSKKIEKFNSYYDMINKILSNLRFALVGAALLDKGSDCQFPYLQF